MHLNESRGNMYEFVTHTWNPISGKCYHDCSYCYMKKDGKVLPDIHLIENELKGIFQRDSFVFIGSGTDMFADNVPTEWIVRVLDFCVEATTHQPQGNKTRFLLQTKNPVRLLEFVDHPLFKSGQVVTCTTIETNRHYPEIMNKAPLPQERADAMAQLSARGIKTYVTVEPLMDFDIDQMASLLQQCNPEQVNIGANTYRKIELPEPDKAAPLVNLILRLLSFTKVKVKKNLNGEELTRALITDIKRNYSYEKRD